AEGAFYRSFFNAGAPTNGAAGTGAGHAQPGSLCIDITNGKAYVNTGTKASPTWVELVRQDGGIADGASAATKADANVIGGLPVLHRIDVPAGATGNVDVTLTHKTRVVDAWLVKNANAGGGAGTIAVQNGASAITDAMSINVAGKTVVRCAQIDQAQHEIAAAGTLRCARTRTASTDEGCTVYVLGLRVA